MGLEERIENSESSGFFDQIWKRKWLRRSVLPLVAATSIFFGAERTLHSATSKQSETLTHDPVLLIHGLGIGQDSLDEYCDFNVSKTVDFDDFFLFSEKFLPDSKYDRGFDINRDGNIGLEDFFIFSSNFGKIIDNPLNPLDGPLESTWDALSISLHRDLGWKNGGTVGKWVSEINLQSADFYKVRLSSGNKLNFNKQGEEISKAVDKILKATEKERVILIGFSMGG